MPSGKYNHKKIPVEVRFKKFWDKMEKPLDGCWIWPGMKDVKGYGRIFVKYRDGRAFGNYAHRLAHTFFIGITPPDMEVCHHCDTPSCARPDHLFLGTHIDNMLDGKSKNRFACCGQNSPKGEAHPNSKLTNEQAQEIRGLYNTTNITMDQLTKKYKVSIGLVHGIIRNKRWVEAGGDATKTRVCRKISAEIYANIRRRYQTGERPSDLAKAYGIAASRIIQIGRHNF